MTDQALVTREPKAALVAGSNIAAIVPRNIEEVFRLAGAIYVSGMAPASLKSSEQVMVAIMAGAEVGFAPFQAVQAFAIINNRPCMWGDAIPALLWTNGIKLEEWFDDEDKATKAFCRITRPDGAVTERTYSLDDAKKANLLGKAGTWQTNQKRMLQMRARGFCARDGAADVLKGFQIREEVEDYGHVRDITPQPTGMRARLEARTAVGGFDAGHISQEIDTVLNGDQIPKHNAKTDEVIETEVIETEVINHPEAAQGAGGANNPDGDEPNSFGEPDEGGFPGDKPSADFDPLAWAADQNHLVDAAKTIADLDTILNAPGAEERFANLKAQSDGVAKALNAAITGKRKALADKERAQ